MSRLLLSLGLFLSSLALATTYRQMDLTTMLQAADLAFYGTVASSTVEERNGAPWTLVTFDVTQALLGEFEETITLSFYGGTLPSGQSLVVAGMPAFQVGDEFVILAYDAPYYSPIVGFSQGTWRLSARGLVDEQGRVLSLDENGQLVADGSGAGTDELLSALQTLLEARP